MSKTAVITGSARGLGFEMAKQFLAHKYNVSICDVNKDALKKAEAELKKLAPKKGMVIATPCDVTKLDDLEKLWAASAKAFGEVDVWVNNAGVNQPMIPLWELEQKTIDLLVDIDLKGAIYGSKVAIAHMKEQGHGCVYCIEGFGADDATQLGLTAYGASKKGVQYLVRGLATELAKFLVKGMVKNVKAKKQDDYIAWLTTKKAAWRFMTAAFNKRDFFAEEK